jgi:hypothetical protein
MGCKSAMRPLRVKKDSSPGTYLSPQKSPKAAIVRTQRTESSDEMQLFPWVFRVELLEFDTVFVPGVFSGVWIASGKHLLLK